MNNKLHAAYSWVLQEALGVKSLAEQSNSSTAYFADNAISACYRRVDRLAAEIESLKQSHVDDVLALKLKLSDLIDTNYKLLQELKGLSQ